MMVFNDLSSIFWKQFESYLWIYVIGLIFLYVIYLQRNYFRSVKVALGIKGVPIRSQINSVHHASDPKYINEMCEQNMMKFWVSIIPNIIIIKPESVQKVLSGSKHIEKSYLYTMFSNYIGKGLIASGGETYKLHVSILQKAFTIPRLEKFTKIFVEHADCFVSSLRDNINEDINITKPINDLIYTMQAETILNLKLNRKNGENNETSYLPFKENAAYADYRIRRPWLLIDFIYKLTKHGKIEEEQLRKNYNFCYDIIKKIEESNLKDASDSMTNEEKKQQTKEKISLIKYLIDIKEKYPNFNDNDILDEVGTFMLAGLESISTATVFALYQLASNPECQEKCVQELNEIFNDYGTLTSMDSFKNMKYLEMCIKETLRLYPSVPLISRRLSEDIEIDGKTLPVGSTIVLLPYVTHRIRNVYLEPESFKPERFEPENLKNIHPYAYIPFSGGNRKCIGYKFAILEMKAILSTVLHNFIMEPVPSKGSLDLRYRMTIRAKGGVWVKFRPRVNSYI